MNTDISTSSARVGLGRISGEHEKQCFGSGRERVRVRVRAREEKRGERKRECVCVVLEEEARQSLASDGGYK